MLFIIACVVSEVLLIDASNVKTVLVIVKIGLPVQVSVDVVCIKQPYF